METTVVEKQKLTIEQEMLLAASQVREYGIAHEMTRDDIWEIIYAGTEIIYLTRNRETDPLVKKIMIGAIPCEKCR